MTIDEIAETGPKRLGRPLKERDVRSSHGLLSTTCSRNRCRTPPIAHHRGWFIFFALLLIVAGAAAIAFPILSSFAVEFWAAIAFAIAGVAQTIHAFAARSWDGFFFGLLIGLLYLASGVVLWLNPLAGVVTLTIFLAAVLVVDGVFRSILAFQIRPRPGWFWLLLGGVVGIVLGVMIWQQLPSSALTVLGLLLGINLVFSGFSFLMLSSSSSAPTTTTA